MTIKALVAVLTVTFAPAAWAADSADCSTAATYFSRLPAGRMVPIWCVALCDNADTDKDCTNFDLKSVGGVPDVLVFELHEIDNVAYGNTGDCTAGTVTINTSTSSTGITTASENAFDIGSTTALAIAGVNKLQLDTKTAPVDRYILATTSNLAANCTADTIDVLMIGYEERKQ